MITKAALLLFRDNRGQKELLFAQEAGKDYFAFPGGKQEAGETIDQTLQRELLEEFGAQATDVRKLGVVCGQTPDGRDIEMHVYTGELQGEPQPQGEIEAIAWLTKEGVRTRPDDMTPMTLDHVVPFLEAEGIW